MIYVYSADDYVDYGRILNDKYDDFERPTIVSVFPEQHQLLPRKQFEYGYNAVQNALKEGYDVHIATYSEHVFNGIRCAIKENGKDNKAKPIAFVNREQKEAFIDKNGMLTTWFSGIFDAIDSELMRLLMPSEELTA